MKILHIKTIIIIQETKEHKSNKRALKHTSFLVAPIQCGLLEMSTDI